ncbi:MAG TPA: response regulator transcription factor [Kiritimatiellia bacterium]|jgi:two-component system copper resistance phosphate regulon response regulator CusR
MTALPPVPVLLVEDDLLLAATLKKGLEEEGFSLTIAGDICRARRALDASTFKLIVLDLWLPDGEGLDVLRNLRARGVKLPVLILSARGELEDRVTGIESGADDYLTKPFAFVELLARVRALLRRANAEEQGMMSRDIRVEAHTRAVWRSGQRIDLSPREYDLLVYLMRHEGSCVSRDMLARDVWRVHSRATPLDNVIDVGAYRLRLKINLAGHPNPVQTVRGAGFLFAWPP